MEKVYMNTNTLYFKFTGDNFNELFTFCRGYCSIDVTTPHYEDGRYYLHEIGTGRKLKIEVGDTIFWRDRKYGIIVEGYELDRTIDC